MSCGIVELPKVVIDAHLPYHGLHLFSCNLFARLKFHIYSFANWFVTFDLGSLEIIRGFEPSLSREFYCNFTIKT